MWLHPFHTWPRPIFVWLFGSIWLYELGYTPSLLAPELQLRFPSFPGVKCAPELQLSCPSLPGVKCAPELQLRCPSLPVVKGAPELQLRCPSVPGAKCAPELQFRCPSVPGAKCAPELQWRIKVHLVQLLGKQGPSSHRRYLSDTHTTVKGPSLWDLLYLTNSGHQKFNIKHSLFFYSN